QGHGFVAFFLIATIDEELLAICGHVKSASLTLGSKSMKERMGNAKADCVAGRIYIHRRRVVSGIEEVQLFAVSAPLCLHSAISGDLPLCASTREGSDVNFHPAGFIILVRHPFPIRRNDPVQIIERSLHY